MGITRKQASTCLMWSALLDRIMTHVNFARFEKQKASSYESLISHIISNYFTAWCFSIRWAKAQIYFSHYIKQSRAQTGIRQILFLLTFIAMLSKDLIMLLRASFASFFLARYLNASRQIYISHPIKNLSCGSLPAAERERESEREKGGREKERERSHGPSLIHQAGK